MSEVPILRLLAPNLITLARLLAVPAVVYFVIKNDFRLAFALFLACGVSDAIDGYLAKRLGARSVVGGYLDPLADKVLLVSIYIALGLQGHLPTWLVILAVFRDGLIVVGVVLSHVLGHPFQPAPLLVSKINTALQVALAATVLATLGFDLPLKVLIRALIVLTALATLISGGAYVVQGMRGAARIERAQQ